MKCDGSRKQDITTQIALFLSNLGFSYNECVDFRSRIHKKYKTDECYQILKEIKHNSRTYARYREGVHAALKAHGFFD